MYQEGLVLYIPTMGRATWLAQTRALFYRIQVLQNQGAIRLLSCKDGSLHDVSWCSCELCELARDGF